MAQQNDQLASGESVVARWEARARAAMELERIRVEYPEVFNEFLDCLNSLPKPASEVRSTHRRAATDLKRRNGLTNYDRMTRLFVESENTPATIPELTRQLEMNRGIVSHLIYRSHKESFESVPGEGTKRWRMKADAFRKAKSEPIAAERPAAGQPSGRFAGLKTYQACEVVLRDAGRALKTSEIVEKLSGAGVGSGSSFTNTVHMALRRRNDVFRRENGMWSLVNWTGG